MNIRNIHSSVYWIQMKRSGVSNLPLHGGRCPKWLFPKMKKLGKEISTAIIEEYGEEELIRRLSDPYWFQALGNTLGFDWHSSGLTTTVTGALKEGLRDNEYISVAGGKGKTSLKTPEEIEKSGFPINKQKLIKSSRMSAKVDSNCLQDSFNLYHHTIFYTREGKWAVIQQGMTPEDRYARRYHWISESIDSYIEEPHEAVASDQKRKTLDLTHIKSRETRKTSVDLVNDDPTHLRKYFTGQTTLNDFRKEIKSLELPKHHRIKTMNLSEKSLKSLKKAYELQPRDYEELVSLKGVGKQSLRALALISELIHGTEPSWEDPAKYSFTVGGKDGTPFPVNRDTYDESISFLKESLNKLEDSKEKKRALKKLSEFMEE